MSHRDPNRPDELVFLPLGGCGEIGMNLNAFGFGPSHRRKWLIVDIGVTFGDDTTPGVDVIMPDPTFLSDHKDHIVGAVLTHGHEDHIGAVAHLWPFLRCPLYATPFTATLVRGKLEEAGLGEVAPLEIVELGSRFELGPFDIELVTLTHSILEPNAMVIRTPVGNIKHTGDWKIDPDPLIGNPVDAAKLQDIGEEGILAMTCDSTNVLSPGTSGSEAMVRERIIDLVGQQKGRVALTTFASNVARLETAFEAGRRNGREVCLVGRSMHRIVAAARENGYLSDIPPIISEEDVGYLPEDKVLLLCTGSQGEGRAALTKIAQNNHRHITLDEGDTVMFSSRVIPGNEKTIFALYNLFAEKGIHVLTADDDYIHVSGHPCRDELTNMYQWIRPQISVPIHGESRHLLEHVDLARELQVPEAFQMRNGDMLRLAPGSAEVIDEVPNGRLHLDGEILVPAGSSGLRERRKISFNGLVVATLVFDDLDDLYEDVRVLGFGIPDVKGQSGRTLTEALEEDITDAIDKLSARDRGRDSEVELWVRRVVRGRLKSAWGKRPQIEVQILRLEED